MGAKKAALCPRLPNGSPRFGPPLMANGKQFPNYQLPITHINIKANFQLTQMVPNKRDGGNRNFAKRQVGFFAKLPLY